MAERFKRAEFINLINYWHERADFNQMEEDNMMDTYYKGMEYFDIKFGKRGKTELFPEDIQYLLSIRGQKHYTSEELAAMHGEMPEKMRGKMYKLMLKGFITSYRENNKTYYRITPYGEKMLVDEILNPSPSLKQWYE